VPRVYIEYQGDSMELPLGETLIGRDVGCSLRFNDPTVSRRHLKFVRRGDDNVTVEDLSSTNGTLLNGSVLRKPTKVADGDMISVGNRTLSIKVANSTDEEPKTLTLFNFSAKQAISAIRTTVPMPIAAPQPTHQQCPRCGGPVSRNDLECATCKYSWDFRTTQATAVRRNPLDRRRSERHMAELRLVYVSSELEIEATTRDLSESGVFVCSQVLEPIGTECTLTILVDGGPALRITGVVRRVVEHDEAGDEPVGLGVEFTALGDPEREWIKTTVARMSQDMAG
jgi:hypothetical protein